MNNDDVLTQERIDSMRSNVMGRIRKPRSRAARFAPALVAAAAVSVFGLVGVGYVLGDTSALRPSIQASDSEVAHRDDGGSNNILRGPTMTEQGEATSNSKSIPAEENVIVTGAIEVTVRGSAAAAKLVREQALKLGGRIDSESQNSLESGYAHLTVRVPGAQVAALSEFLETVGEVSNTSIERVQVEQQVQDLDARIGALKVSTERLRSIMNEAKNTTDLLEAESRLAQRQAELESLQSQRKLLGEQTALATIQVTLSETTPAGTVNSGGFRGGLIAGWNALVSLVNMGVTTFGFLLPWLVPVIALGWGTRWLIRRRRRG